MQLYAAPSRLTRTLAVVAATLVLATVTGTAVVAGPDDPGVTERRRGLEMADLVRDERACPGLYRLVGVQAADVCTHGPDPAPPGVNVTRHRPTEELIEGTAEGSSPASTSTVPCYGDGTSGKRVQAVYAYVSGSTDRSATVVDLIGGWAGTVDRIFRDSAAKTGGVRHVRWVTEGDCRLSVMVVQLSPTGADTMSKTINELKAAGLNRTDRKYLVWVDAGKYCGIAQMPNDDRAGSSNAAESGPHYARVDSPCWGYNNSVEAHELMHTLGGVQNSAPNSSGGGHCTVEHDRMCYQDSHSTELTYMCGYSAHERLFDCGDDDYFHTHPPEGSYLATHWNTASSSFLAHVPPGEDEPSDGDSSSDDGTTDNGTTDDPDTSTDTTTTWSDNLNRKTPSRTYEIAAASGELQAVLSFTKADSLTLTVRRSDGTLVAEKTGASPLALSAAVSEGIHHLTVSIASGNTSFTLEATYPTASDGPATTTTTTTTSTWSGTLNRNVTSRSYEVLTGSGTLQASLSFTKADTLTLTLLDAAGNVVDESTGADPVTLAAPVSAGTHHLLVSSSSGNVSFTLTAVHPTQ